MPLRLKSLELHGYKTFASKTNFEFSGGVTAIVGPNGSGKSNIADALRWVLGEQSYSLLRGKKTEDMIFSGSENRPRAGMASASIIFDNADNWLPVDFSEVELARHAYRDGRNDYLLNSQHVRLREINELLAQSGLSERTYTILGQGLVDASLALKADERRRLFEEAAGIGIYRTRREEALRRLESTRRNLDRVQDILAELGPRLKSLEKQAKRSQDYLQVQADLRSSLREWYGYHWHNSQKEMNTARELFLHQDEKLKVLRESHNAIRQEFVEFRDKLQSLRSRLNSWHRESARLHSDRETISREMAVLDERHRSLIEIKENTINDLNRLSSELEFSREKTVEKERETSNLKRECDEAGAQLLTAQEALNAKQLERSKVEGSLNSINLEIASNRNKHLQSITRHEEILSRIEGQKKKLAELIETINSYEEELSRSEKKFAQCASERERLEDLLSKNEIRVNDIKKDIQKLEVDQKTNLSEKTKFENEITRLKVQLDVLEQSEVTLTGYAEGTRTILDASRKSKLRSGFQALSTMVDVPAEFELAVASVLGEFVDSIVMESTDHVEDTLKLLEDTHTGRATLIPADRLIYKDSLTVPNDPECLGLACDKVRTTPEYRAIVDYLLGRVLIVTDRHAVGRFLKGLEKDVKIVTLAGEVFYASGPVQAGKLGNAGTLGRTRQKRENREEIIKLEKKIETLNSTLQDIEKKLKAYSDDLISHVNLSEQTSIQLKNSILEERRSKEDFEKLKNKHEWQIDQQTTLKREIETANSDSQNLISDLAVFDEKLIDLQKEFVNQSNIFESLDLKELIEQVTYWNTQAAVGSEGLRNSQARLSELLLSLDQKETQYKDLQKRILEFDETINTIQNEKINYRTQENDLNAKLEELRLLIDPSESNLETAEQNELEIQQKEIKSQQILSTAERYFNQVQLDYGRKQEAVENLRQKIEDDFGLVSLEYATNVDGPVPLPLDGMVEQLVSVEALSPDLEEVLSRQRMTLRRMGPINPEAQQEYESVSERFKFLGSQLDDLHKAEIDLRQVINELDDITRQEFLKTFSAVAEEFKIIFHRLFGGGSAKLMLTDPDDLTETGIDIEARLPGKREQGLALLSGGERSLTAIALVFSLLKVSPTPVCVMDEVDAMLDEANVGRFRDLVRELSLDTQFIIITHNRNTVQAADVIYGVTMGHDSVSQIISLKLDEVSDDILKGGGL